MEQAPAESLRQQLVDACCLGDDEQQQLSSPAGRTGRPTTQRGRDSPRHVTVDAIRLDVDRIDAAGRKRLSRLVRALMDDLEANSELKEIQYKKFGKRRIQFIFPKMSKPLIDDIDRELARYYGLTPEEVDFLVNYDLKYRVGVGGSDEGDD